MSGILLIEYFAFPTTVSFVNLHVLVFQCKNSRLPISQLLHSVVGQAMRKIRGQRSLCALKRPIPKFTCGSFIVIPYSAPNMLAHVTVNRETYSDPERGRVVAAHLGEAAAAGPRAHVRGVGVQVHLEDSNSKHCVSSDQYSRKSAVVGLCHHVRA